MENHNTNLVRLSKNLNDSSILDAKLTEAHYNRAVGYLKIGQLELATQASMDALEINPNYAPVHALLEPLKQEYLIRGLTFLKENKFEQAVHAFQCAVTIDPTFVDAHYEIGRVYLEQGKLEMAKIAVDKVLESDFNYLPAHSLLKEIKHAYFVQGLTSLDENRCDNAISDFQHALAINAGFAEAHCGLVRAYLRQLEKKKKDSERINLLVLATKSVEEAVRIDSDYELARGLSNILHNLWLEEDAYHNLLDSLIEGIHLNVVKLVESGKLFTNIGGELEFLFSVHIYSEDDYENAEDYDRNVWLAATGDTDQYTRYCKIWGDLVGLVYDRVSDKYTLHYSGNLSSKIRDWPWQMIATLSLYLEAERDICGSKSSFDQRVTMSLESEVETSLFPENLYSRAFHLHQNCKRDLTNLTKDHEFLWDVLGLILPTKVDYYSQVGSMIMEAYYDTPEAYQQYLREEAEAYSDLRETELNDSYEENFIHEEVESNDPYEEEMWLEYQEIMSEQDGFYPSYGWYEEYDMLDELEGSEHY